MDTLFCKGLLVKLAACSDSGSGSREHSTRSPMPHTKAQPRPLVIVGTVAPNPTKSREL